VVYGDEPSQAPSNRIHELGGQSDDINYQFGGSYVWLVPDYTNERENGAIGFDLVIQGSEDPSLKDLAKGAGGDYRYLIVNTDISQERKITALALLRSESSVDMPPLGWDEATIDINKGRGKMYLYLVWKLST
ncbi:uncharacterized protein PHACADRAFT_92490, partial [Phanerochaete carnosa HHB-10118-sp]